MLLFLDAANLAALVSVDPPIDPSRDCPPDFFLEHDLWRAFIGAKLERQRYAKYTIAAALLDPDVGGWHGACQGDS